MSTYTSLTYHIIFSTKYRKPRIDAALRDDLFAYIGGIIRETHGVTGVAVAVVPAGLLRMELPPLPQVETWG